MLGVDVLWPPNRHHRTGPKCQLVEADLDFGTVRLDLMSELSERTGNRHRLPECHARAGSRGGLFDAVADNMFMSAGMADIAATFELPDPIAVMEASFPIGSRMYASGRAVWHALLAMGGIDRSASDAMLRTERRRAASMRDLAARLEHGGLLGEGVDRDAAFAQLWVVTSFDVFDLLTDVGLDPDDVTRWMFRTTKQTLKLERLGLVL